MDDKESSGEIDLKFYRCEDDDCDSVEISNEVEAGERAYFAVEICNGEDLELLLQASL